MSPTSNLLAVHHRVERFHPGLCAVLGDLARRSHNGPLGSNGMQFEIGGFSTYWSCTDSEQAVIWPFSLLLVVAMMLTSLCQEYYQVILCQRIILGFSCGLIFAPALTVVGHYLFKKRAMAGSPIGGIIYPVILKNLIDNPNVGFLWAQRACGFPPPHLGGYDPPQTRHDQEEQSGHA